MPEDDPELVAFEAAIRRRNIIVGVIGGMVCLPIGALFMVLGFGFRLGNRIDTVGGGIFMMGVVSLVSSWRLAHGAPITPDQAPPEAELRARRRGVAMSVAFTALFLVTGAILIAVGSAAHKSRWMTIGAGFVVAGLVVARKAWIAAHQSDAADDA